MRSLAESCSRQLRAWADSLQNSQITGPRYLNQHTRSAYVKRKASEAGAARFQDLLEQHLPPDHPLRKKLTWANKSTPAPSRGPYAAGER